ncbi:MAG TPA: TetR/AcrR family transcriptional regulator [Alphaproteobacteria bacterium]|jgi:AcrR family transcriptional regulator|nr:TetR/AcrR family transcriptional regulator [Alphaproteobacteria bacterium]
MSTIAQRSVERSLAGRHATYTEEVNRLIASCLAVTEQTGNFDPRVSDILADAGLSNQAFYRHFRSKEELLLAVLDKGARELNEYLSKRMAAQADPVGKVRAWVRGFAAQAIRPKARAATRPFMFPSARLYERFPDEIPATEGLYLDLLETQLRAGVKAKAMRPDLDPAGDAVFIYDLVKNWMERQMRECPTPPENELKRRAEKLEFFVVKAIGAN